MLIFEWILHIHIYEQDNAKTETIVCIGFF